jgi:hypothetical protein
VTIAGNKADGSNTDDSSIGSTGGGGMCNYSSSPILTNVIIVDNQTSGEGGGMSTFSSSSILTNVTIAGNHANIGGGMYNYHASPIFTNVTITGNQASSDGGGMYNEFSAPILTNVTITGNQASSGGGMYNYYGSSPIFRNSIVWGNTGGNVYSDSDSTPTWTYSLVEGSAWVPDWGTQSTGANFLSASPFAAEIPAAPSTAGNYQLKAGVIGAIDTGSNTLYFDQAMPADWETKTGLVWADTLAKDAAGNTRKVNNTIDMGAYEKQ